MFLTSCESFQNDCCGAASNTVGNVCRDEQRHKQDWKFERFSTGGRQRDGHAALFQFPLIKMSPFKALEVSLVIWKAVVNINIAIWEGCTHLSNTKHF